MIDIIFLVKLFDFMEEGIISYVKGIHMDRGELLLVQILRQRGTGRYLDFG